MFLRRGCWSLHFRGRVVSAGSSSLVGCYWGTGALSGSGNGFGQVEVYWPGINEGSSFSTIGSWAYEGGLYSYFTVCGFRVLYPQRSRQVYGSWHTVYSFVSLVYYGGNSALGLVEPTPCHGISLGKTTLVVVVVQGAPHILVLSNYYTY